MGAEEGAQDGPAEDSHGVGADQLADKLLTGGLQNGDDVGPHQVQVLLTEVRHLSAGRGRPVSRAARFSGAQTRKGE